MSSPDPRAQLSAGVSVVVPARNEAATLGPFLDSLLAQNRKPDEIVICDGGSTDDSVRTLRARQRQVDGLKLVLDVDAYPGRARNLAIAASSHEWVAMTDAGTVVPPTWLESLIESRDAVPGSDVVFGGYEPIEGGSWVQDGAALVCLAPRRRTVDGSGYLRAPTTASMMLKKGVWKAAGGFPEDLRAAEDLVFFDRIAALGVVAVDAPDAIVHWQMPASLQDLFRRYRAFSRHTLRAGLWRRWHWPVGGMYGLGSVAIGLGAFHSPWWLVALPLAFVYRVSRAMNDRRPPFGDAGALTAWRCISAGAITIVVDVAMWLGLADFLRMDLRR